MLQALEEATIPVCTPVRCAFNKETRLRHVRLLKLLAEESYATVTNNPVEHVIEVIENLRGIRTWQASTTLTNANALCSALERTEEYRVYVPPLRLADDPLWRDAVRFWAKLERQERNAVPPSVTKEQMISIIEGAATIEERIFYILTWSHCARPGNVLSLRSGDLTVTACETTIHWAEAKTTAARGPYTTNSNFPAKFKKDIQEWIRTRPLNQQLFVTRKNLLMANLRAAIRKVVPNADVRAVRRGSLQQLAQQGTPTETLLLFSGHLRVQTLMRYLGHGRAHAANKKAATEAANLLW